MQRKFSKVFNGIFSCAVHNFGSRYASLVTAMHTICCIKSLGV